MRIALLANPDNIHSRRWIDFLAGRGHELLVVADPHTSGRLQPPPAPGASVRIEVARWSLAANILAFRLTPRPHGNCLWKFLAYRPILLRFRPDVVHGFEAYYNGLATAWSGPWPTVLTPWGKDVHHDAFKGPIWNWIIRRALRGVDLISTNDETMPEHLERAFGISPDKVRAFSWGVDRSVFRPRPDEARALRVELGLPPGAPVVLSPRRFDPYWGAETLMGALPEVLRARPDARAVILAVDGPAEFIAAARRRVEEAGLSERVVWISARQSPDRMAALYSMADLFVSAPKSDLLAMTVLEAMACGCFPVLADLPAYRRRINPEASRAGGVPEGVNGVLLPTGFAENEISESVGEPGSDAAAMAAAIVKTFADPARARVVADCNVRLTADLDDAARNMARMEDVYREAIAHAAAREACPL